MSTAAGASASFEDVAEFRHDAELGRGMEVLIVVKSQDQRARRARLLESKRRNTIGRIAPRPASEGLLVRARLTGERIDAASSGKIVRIAEPRDICPAGNGQHLLTAIDRVLLLDPTGDVRREYVHPFFAFLHSIVLHPTGNRFLVVSSGYDALFEVACDGAGVRWEWFGWEHGFNPAPDGTFLTRREEERARLAARGARTLLVDPRDFGPQGLVTAARTTHPSAACYADHEGRSILACLGQLGRVVEIDIETGRAITRVEGLQQLPHAILPDVRGWMVTNTLAGELWRLDREFRPWSRVGFAGLPGKPQSMAGDEWIQAVVPLGCGLHVAIDANRGLIVLDLARRTYRVQPVCEDWSIQTIVCA